MKKNKPYKPLTKNQIIVRTALVLLAIALIMFAVYKIGDYFQDDTNDERGIIDESTLRLSRIEYNGRTYVENPDVTTMLLLGVDKDSALEQIGYRDGGQSDFIMLIVMDGANKTIRRLQIDRDTMTQVPVLGIMGKETGTNLLQIALSHNFGATALENNQNTVKAVQNLLEGSMKVDMCASLYMGGIGDFNDMLGGVTVLISDDFSAVTDALPMGQTITLMGDLAEIYTRSRHNVGLGTNEERMKSRQNTYMSAALDKLVETCKSDANYAADVINKLMASDYFVTDISAGRLINEVNKAVEYTILPIDYINGTSEVNEKTGFNEFTPDDEWITQWVLNTYYNAE